MQLVLINSEGVALFRGVTLLKEVYHCGLGLWDLLCTRFTQLTLRPLPVACWSTWKILISFFSTMSAYITPGHTKMVLNLWKCKPSHLFFPLKELPWLCTSSQQKKFQTKASILFRWVATNLHEETHKGLSLVP